MENILNRKNMLSGIGNIRKYGLKYKYVCSYLAGIIIGTIVFNFLRSDYETYLISYGKYIFSAINSENINKGEYFFSTLSARIKETALCIIISFTPFSRFYGMCICLKYGLSIGMTLSTAVACYKSMGIIIFLMSILPYGIVLTVLLCLMIMVLEEGRPSADFRNIYVAIFLVMITEVFMESFF